MMFGNPWRSSRAQGKCARGSPLRVMRREKYNILECTELRKKNITQFHGKAIPECLHTITPHIIVRTNLAQHIHDVSDKKIAQGMAQIFKQTEWKRRE